MKKRFIALCLALACLTGASARTTDAFQGVLPVTDPTMKKSLAGEWSLKVVEGITDDPSVPPTDETWGVIPVPGCWEAYGFCKPKYDSPERLTGYYRTKFEVPREWKEKRIIIGFDGVLYGYDLWVNGQAAGSWRSAYNTALFDITPYIDREAESQELALRVISQFRGSDFDYNDDWAPNGIFRDVTLMAVPETHLSDLTIRTRNSGEVEAVTLIAGDGGTVSHEILDAQGRKAGTDKVENPHLWTAETPYLYTLRTTLSKGGEPLQTFEHKFGFREISVDGNILKVNGRPVKLRGVTCHSTDPRTVKVIADTLTLKDMKLMKEASVNCIRTSHYPREPRFYELADSLGFYVIDEVPFGYGDRNLHDETFYPVLEERARATIGRDKNHPSVIIWSLGNENPLTDICVRLGSFVEQELDSTRPYCYPQVGSYFRRFFEGDKAKGFPAPAPLYTPHYPTTGQIAGFYQHLDRPVIFTEYCHTLGISFEDHDRQWEIIERTPGIAGGAVWEWVDQGMPFDAADPTTGYGFEEKVYTSPRAGFEMCGNKGTDGLLYANRVALPNYYELQHNYARAFIADSILTSDGPTLSLDIANRFDFIDLKDNVTFEWVYTEDLDTIARCAFSPQCVPHETVRHTLRLPAAPDTSRLGILHLTATDAQGNTFLHRSLRVDPSPLAPRMLAALTEPTADPMSIVQDGMLIRAGRKPTLAEVLKVGDKRLERYLLPLTADSPVKADVTTSREGNATRVSFTLTPDTTDTFLSEAGLAFLLDSAIDRVQWIGNGPLPTYPGRFRAGRYGLHALRQADIYFEGNRRGVDAALLTDKEGNGLLLVTDNGNVSFEQTDRGIVVSVNAAVSGEGPKFSRTAFPVVAAQTPPLSGEFYLYRVEASRLPALLEKLFAAPADIPAPLHSFETQYDTYLMRYDDIKR